jgi:2-dehydro-3-deoxy-D-arabinonate dehydratase
MIVYHTTKGILLEKESRFYRIKETDWNQLFNRKNLASYLKQVVRTSKPLSNFKLNGGILPPIDSQEVWAAGVTYYRSRTARVEESKVAGGGNFYDRVYEADRPELFFKATPHRVVGHGQKVKIRRDSKWNVPEPELTLAISKHGKIVGYTIGNDMSSRDIEGENPLYLPQAKVYQSSAGLGPGIFITDQKLSADTEIKIEIRRGKKVVFKDKTQINKIKRSFPSLVEFLFRDNSFPEGCFLMTGTGIVPPDSFTLASGDEILISITGMGTLCNVVE